MAIVQDPVTEYRIFKLHVGGIPLDIAEEIAESNVDTDLALKAYDLCLAQGYEDYVAGHVCMYLVGLREVPLWETCYLTTATPNDPTNG